MTSQRQVLGWVLIGAALIVGTVAAVVYRDQISTFIVRDAPSAPSDVPAGGAGTGAEALVFLARVEGDETQRAVTDFTTAPGTQVTYSAHFFTPRTKDTFRGNVVIDVNEFYLTNITGISKGGTYDGDKITWPVNGKATFGRFSFTGTTQFSTAAAANTRITSDDSKVSNKFTVQADFCLDRGVCQPASVQGTLLQAFRARALGASLSASVQGGGTAKAGKTLIYDLILTNASRQPITVSGSASWPQLLAPSVVTQPSSGTISFQGKKMNLSGVTIPANGTITAQLSAVVGKIQKGQPQHVELILTASNGDSVRTGSNIKGNFILVEIGAAGRSTNPTDLVPRATDI